MFLLIFKNFQLRFLDFGQKVADFYKILEKIFKKTKYGR